MQEFCHPQKRTGALAYSHVVERCGSHHAVLVDRTALYDVHQDDVFYQGDAQGKHHRIGRFRTENCC